MTDRITKERRSWNMSRIKDKNTKPEIIVRSLLHNLGYRFRLNGKVSIKKYHKGVLPGKPDIVLSKYKTVVFVNGCFWHRHKNCKLAYTPKTHTDFWIRKFTENIKRDKLVIEQLTNIGWTVFIIWECELKNINELKDRICKGLKNDK